MLELAALLELAAGMERAGADLYRSLAAGCVAGSAERDLFSFLASQEDAHEVWIADFRRTLPDTSIPGYDDIDPVAARAFKRVFSSTRLSDERSRAEDSRSILDFAIRREMDGIMLYHELSARVPEPARSRLLELVAEEREHFAMLASLRAEGD
jgi:rubrerythrin